MSCERLVISLGVLCLGLSGIEFAYAQDPRGAISGRISDPSGAVMSGVEVRALNADTGVGAGTRTNDTGNYLIPYLLPGTYTVQASAAGFKKFVREGIQVRVGESVELHFQMQLGETTESVEVRAETPLLNVAEASLGQVVEERRIVELPSYGGSPYSLTLLAAGTVNGTDLRRRNVGGPAALSRFSSEGVGTTQNEFTIDGVANTQDGNVAFVPPQEAVGEFKVQGATYDASLGHAMGTVVNVAIKSGTNKVRGEAHWFTQNRVFDAPTIFQNRTGQKLPVYQNNRYGASLGGPVRLPKIYNGASKTFFFYTWEENPYGNPVDYVNTVPTPAMKRGDFSALLAVGSGYQIYDPATTVRLATGRYQRQPFANNIIPASRLDPVGQNLLKYYPEPNQPGTRDFRQNFALSRANKFDSTSHLARVDHAFSEKHRGYLRLLADDWTSDVNRVFGTEFDGTRNRRRNRGLALDDVYVFNPTFMLNVRYGVHLQDYLTYRHTRGFDLASLGFSSQFLAQLPDRSLWTFPNLQVGSLTQLSRWTGTQGDGTSSWLTHALSGHLTKLRGNHNIRFGAEFRAYRETRNRYPTDVSPQLVYSSTYTRGPLDSSPAPTLGGELASLLLGIPGGTITRSASYAQQDLHLGLYVHDDFRVSRKLTFSFGVRYELETPVTERFNRSVAHFAFDQPNPIEAEARSKYGVSPIPELPPNLFRVLGGLTFPGVQGNPRNLWTGEKNNVMPRVGFGFQLTDRIVLNAGYGIFFDTIGVNATDAIQSGFSQSTPIIPSFDNGLTFVATNANPFPNGILAPLGASGGLFTFLGQSISFFPEHRKHPYAQKWSAGIRSQLPSQFVVGMMYVGTRSTRIGVTRSLNATPAGYLSRMPTRDQKTIDFLSAVFPNPFYGINSVYTQNISRARLLTPYPHFSGVSATDPVGYSWYHSLQLSSERRFSRGFTFQLAYTWSKLMEATSFLNETDLRPYESISSLDRIHRIAASGIWELPFGRKRRFGSRWPKALDFVVGSWQINGVVQRQSGPPLDWGDIWTLFTGNPDDVKLPKSQRSVDRWFNTQAGFNRVTAQQLAYNIRVSPLRFSGLRADGQSRWDFSAIKTFKAVERLEVQVRAECINSFNHPNLFAPSTSPTSSAFGTITEQNPARTWQMSLKLKF